MDQLIFFCLISLLLKLNNKLVPFKYTRNNRHAIKLHEGVPKELFTQGN